jgi:hypothetical protein
MLLPLYVIDTPSHVGLDGSGNRPGPKGITGDLEADPKPKPKTEMATEADPKP